MNRLSLAAAGTAALMFLAACGSSAGAGGGGTHAPTGPAASGPAGATQPASGPTITISNFGYTGALTVTPGATVTVVNRDSVAHTLTDKQTHAFDTGNIAGSGGTGTFTAPTKPGSYPFGCTYHPEMSGVLTVSG
jgi:plastocyanin